MKKTNAMRIIENKKIHYTTLSYTVDSEHHGAVHTAEKMGIDPDRLFKTIVMIGTSKDVFVFCVPSRMQVSLKKIKTIIGEKITPLKLNELQNTTGYIRGGCSPIGMKKPFPVFIDETALLHETIYVNAGERGLLLCLTPHDIQFLCSAVFSDITE